MTMKFATRHLGCLCLFALLCIPLQAVAMEISFQSDSLIQAFERDTTKDDNTAVIPLHEYMRFDGGNREEPGLTFHLYGWARLDLADSQYFEDTTDSELFYGYLEYSHELASFNARLGRQYVFEGVANEVVDGLRLSSDLGKYFSGSFYAGLPAALASDNSRDGDSIYGWRLVNHLPGYYDIGVSYKNLTSDSDDSEEMAGVDMSLYLPFNITLSGSSSLNLLNASWAEHSYELSIPAGPLLIRPYVQKFSYEDYFGTGTNSANPFRFLANSNEELLVLGTDLTLPVGERWTLVGKGKNYDYETLEDGSQYFSLQATWTGEERGQCGGELGVMSSDTAQNDYVLFRLFTYWDRLSETLPVSFLSGDLVYVSYDQSIYGQDSSFFASIGAGKSLMENSLKLKLSADFSSDPYFDQDLRGMLTASYRFGKSL